MEGVQAAIDAVQRADRAPTCARPRSCSRTGRSPSSSTTRARTAGTSATSTSATRPSPSWTRRHRQRRVLEQPRPVHRPDAGGAVGEQQERAAAVGAAVRRVVRDVPQPRAGRSASTSRARPTEQVAPHTGDDPLVGWRREPEREHPRRRQRRHRGRRRRGLLDLVLHRGGLGLRLRRGARRRRVGDRAAVSTTTAPRSRPTPTRTTTTRRATASPGPPAARTSSTTRTYIHLQSAPLPAGTTDVRFRYSTDAAYLDTGFFVDDVTVGGQAATLSSEPGNWIETNGHPGQQLGRPAAVAVRPHPGRHVDGRDRRQRRATTSTGSRATRSTSPGFVTTCLREHQGRGHRRHLEPDQRRHPGARRRLRLPAHRERERQQG